MNIKFPEPQFENIEIRCKTGKKEEIENTWHLVNELSLAYEYASKFLQGQGCQAMAEDFNQKSQILFAVLLVESDIYKKYM